MNSLLAGHEQNTVWSNQAINQSLNQPIISQTTSINHSTNYSLIQSISQSLLNAQILSNKEFLVGLLQPLNYDLHLIPFWHRQETSYKIHAIYHHNLHTVFFILIFIIPLSLKFSHTLYVEKKIEWKTENMNQEGTREENWRKKKKKWQRISKVLFWSHCHTERQGNEEFNGECD